MSHTQHSDLTYWQEKVERLTTLCSRLQHPRQSTSETEIIDILDGLAVALRDESLRAPIGSLGLPDTLTGLLQQAITVDLEEVVKQVGRVAANLAVENDFNRELLAKAGFIDHVLSTSLLDRNSFHPSDQALIASLYNLVVQGNSLCISIFHQENHLRCLCRLAIDHLQQVHKSNAVGIVDLTITQWLWSILNAVINNNGDNDSKMSNQLPLLDLFNHFRYWTPPASLSDFVIDNGPESPLNILLSSCQVIENLLSDHSDILKQLMEDDARLPKAAKHPLELVLDFVELANLPLSWTNATIDQRDDGESASEEEDFDARKLFGEAKACLFNGIVSFSSELAFSTLPLGFWTRMRSWLDNDVSDRRDLVECALLSYGNSIIGDTVAIEYLVGETTLLPRIKSLLKPDAPATTQHAIVGLLRNLSIPDKNKSVLYEAGVIDDLIGMGVWSENRDMLGSVQGGVVGIFKNLCRNQSDIASYLMSSYKDDLISLCKRTNDQAIKFEGTRVFVSAARNLPKGMDSQGVNALCDERIVKLLVDMMLNASQYPVLENEAVLGLAFLSMFSSANAIVIKELTAEKEGGTGKACLEQMVANKDLLKEGRENAEVLLSLIRDRLSLEA
ncbi:hypothetical protein C343_05287 [Cryptococcus neoformans C23]|uniref:Uncharacterized protein n=1 Tax=Cryptococcus neoformans (strain H99 / ATCC 208821 / CBS 10515 / FGSC 9487) TaxID=235443 RepID=J9VRQ1_CRYN9|nr:hypothetical protein CNAG_04432 [Cryptococcus neoformans var. grubii H99]AFR97152.2 hypothetical protein CNAG_04432 [Cryptococcus neoformans var. grubii H99]AUB27136.1 hypothetical protein CKF44_04432 [Cryptococcus neoformans var. grubii]OWZ40808.1 hypothetical protein C343_05287 [Cryptococcus neoformans var. grubii C23]|eukprot:XP_012051530.1 hypothetical protein CNAG_04432 [Cryptococcus neoformans var. grubii H99]